MAFIETIGLRGADGELLELYRAALDTETGALDNVMAVHGLHPAGLRAHLALYTVAMSGTRGLRKVDREMIALVVSQLNHCHY